MYVSVCVCECVCVCVCVEGQYQYGSFKSDFQQSGKRELMRQSPDRSQSFVISALACLREEQVRCLCVFVLILAQCV